MDIKEARKILEDSDYLDLMNLNDHIRFFEMISTYLLEKGPSHKDLKFREEMFSALTVCLYSITGQRNILTGLTYEKTFQKVFRKLVNEDNWDCYDSPRIETKDDLSLLHQYWVGLKHLKQNRGKLGVRKSIIAYYDNDFAFTEEERNYLFALGKENLLAYLNKRSLRSVWSIWLTVELMYQLNLSDKNTISNLLSELISNEEGCSGKLYILRDDEIRENVISFLNKKLKTDKRLVEVFLYSQFIQDGFTKEEAHIGFDIEDMEPICSNYLKLELESQKKREQLMFAPSEIDKNLSRFEIVVEISFWANKLSNYAHHYPNPKKMFLEVIQVIKRFIKSEFVKNNFLIAIKGKEFGLTFNRDKERRLTDYQAECVKRWVNYTDKDYKECLDLFEGLEECLSVMRVYFGYQLRSQESFKLCSFLTKDKGVK
jgi:hypothetical protein